ncbi:tigger transposable element-derived protein 4 [Trichonephila clavipes]|nr:tigger transposable element-derived protein 4 [Trichonephila clavipes]
MSKRKCLSIKEKNGTLQEMDKGVKKKDIALKFGIPPNSLSTIIRNRDKLQNYDSLNSCSKRLRTLVYEDVDEAVLKWIRTMRDKNVPISQPLVIEKALQFAKALGHDQLLAQTHPRPSAAEAELLKRMCVDEPPAHLSSEHPLPGGTDDETVPFADVTSPLQSRRNGGKEVKLFTNALKAFQCNNHIVMAQGKHLDDFLRGRIIGRLECGRTQLEVSEELGIAQSVISRLWQRFQDDVNLLPKETDLSRQLSSATGTTVSRQTVYGRLGHIGLYARRPVRCVPLTATHCRLRLTWSREHALWTPQQWSCLMFSDESRFS